MKKCVRVTIKVQIVIRIDMTMQYDNTKYPLFRTSQKQITKTPTCPEKKKSLVASYGTINEGNPGETQIYPGG